MNNDIEEILFTEDEIEDRIRTLGEQITKDYKDKDLVCISLLKGSVFFASSLLKRIDTKLCIDFMDISTYGSGTVSNGKATILKDLEYDVKNKDVLIVEDIIDTGYTLYYVKNLLKKRGANSVEVAVMLDKPDRRKIDVDVKYLGFKIPDYFVVGYGLDFNEKYRNLPYIGYLKEELYK